MNGENFPTQEDWQELWTEGEQPDTGIPSGPDLPDSGAAIEPDYDGAFEGEY